MIDARPSRPRHADLTLEMVERAIASRFPTLRFDEELERRYQDDIGKSRMHALVLVSIIGMLFFDLFLIDDWRMNPATFGTPLLLRLGVLTPAGLFCILRSVGQWRWSLEAAEKSASFIAILATVLTMILYVRSGTTPSVAYHYGCALIMILVALVQRVRIRLCVFSIVTILAAQIAGLLVGPSLTAMTIQGDCVFFAGVAFLVLFAAYGFEHEYRHGYLLSVRGDLLNDHLANAANVDPLTGLWNRRHLTEVMASAWAEAAHTPRAMAVLILDLDHFKTFNDTYGHLAGDDCLRHVGDCIRRGLVVFGDMAVRFGGEEFMIFIADIDAAEAQAAAAVLHHAMHEEAIPYPALGEGAIVTASIGLATGLAPFVSASTLMGQADEALYEAKRAGRDCVRTRMIDPVEASRRLPITDTGSVREHPAPT